MQPFNLYSGTTSGVQATAFLPQTKNNTGHVQVVGNGTVTIEGSANGVNFIPVVTGVTSSAGQYIALFPFMRANITAASGTTTVFLVI